MKKQQAVKIDDETVKNVYVYEFMIKKSSLQKNLLKKEDDAEAECNNSVITFSLAVVRLQLPREIFYAIKK